MDADRMEVSELVPSNSANVEGMFVGPISPIKTSRKNDRVHYFDGCLSDGSKTVRFVSFDPKLRPQIEKAKEDLRGVSLTNCAVKRNRGEMEVVVSTQSKILNSPKKFKVDESTLMNGSQGGSNMDIASLDMIGDIHEHQYISVKGKVVAIREIEKVVVKSSGKMLTKRECLFADSTAVYRCVVWEDQVKVLHEEKSYKLSKATVRSFNSRKYLSVGEGCHIVEIEDIGNVIDDETAESESGRAKVVKGDIVAVTSLDLYKGCRNCNAKVVDNNANAMAVCSKCSTKMKVARCTNQKVANVILEGIDRKEYRVTIFNEVLDRIISICEANDEGDVTDQLLTAPTLTFTISHKDVVSSFSMSV